MSDPGLLAARASGPFPVRLHAITLAAANVNFYEFRPLDASALPAFTAGAHIDVRLENGLLRQYSLVNSQDDRHRYVIAVKRDPASRGGSSWLHDRARVGAVMTIDGPRNNFPLHEEAPYSVFIAGGIGITPIACMVSRLRMLARENWELHYCVRTREEALFAEEFVDRRVHLHIDDERGGAFLDVPRIVSHAPAEAHLYCCGPTPMLESFQAATRDRKAEQTHLERFSASQKAANGGFAVELARSARRVFVRSEQSIVQALRDAGIQVPTSCELGICGTCETTVLAGVPDHRDEILSPQERAANKTMMICCSGSREDLLVLDL